MTLSKIEREAVGAADQWMPIFPSESECRIIGLEEFEGEGPSRMSYAIGYLAGQRAAYEDAAKIADEDALACPERIRARLAELETP